MRQIFKVTALISTSIIIFLWFEACIYLAILGHYIYPESIYAVSPTDKDYYHAFLIIDGKPKDPQLLFIGLDSGVDYNNPIFTTNLTSELLNRTYTWHK